MTQYEIPYPDSLPSKDGGTVPFDPINDPEHRRRLDRILAGWRSKHPTAKLDMIDGERRVVVFREPQVASIVQRDKSSMLINLTADQQKKNKGYEVASMYESRNPGYRLTEFHPYEGTALLERMTDEEVTARGLICEYVKCDPWNVKVKENKKDGGFTIRFLAPFVFQQETNGPQLDNAAVAIGHDGWWSQVDARTGEGRIIPGEPPTFLKSHDYPFDMLGSSDCFSRTPYGVALPKRGGDDYEPVFVDWKANSFLLVGGEPGSGKSVGVNGMLAQLIAQRVELTIIDLTNKASDYYWLRPWVTKGHWGCESIVQSAGVLNNLVKEIEQGERARVWKENALQNWYDAPRWVKEKYPRHLIVVDEFSSLVDEARVVADIPNPEKKLPAVFERLYRQQAEYDIRSRVQRLLRTARAQGYMMIVISQTISQQSGLGPSIRDLFGHHCVMGASPSQAMVKGAFHDPASIPPVPARVFEDDVAKGVGRMEPAGGKGLVFKTCYAGRDGVTDTEALGRALVDVVGLPEDVDRDRYLSTLRPPSESHPVDAEYMRFLTQRISIPLETAVASDGTLKSLRDAWDESKRNFGDDDDGDAPTTPAPSSPKSGPKNDGSSSAGGVRGASTGRTEGLMDARELARLMEGRS